MHPEPAAACLPPFSLSGSAAQCDQQNHPKAQPQGSDNADYKTANLFWGPKTGPALHVLYRGRIAALQVRYQKSKYFCIENTYCA